MLKSRNMGKCKFAIFLNALVKIWRLKYKHDSNKQMLLIVVFWPMTLSHILVGADIVRTKIREDKIKDHLLQYIKSGYFPEIVFCKNMKIKFQIFCH